MRKGLENFWPITKKGNAKPKTMKKISLSTKSKPSSYKATSFAGSCLSFGVFRSEILDLWNATFATFILIINSQQIS